MLNLTESLPDQLFGYGGGSGTIPGQLPDILQNHNHVLHEELLTAAFKLRISHGVLLHLWQPGGVVNILSFILLDRALPSRVRSLVLVAGRPRR
jgi:hypothetical protein